MRKPINMRLPEELVESVDTYARDHQTSRTSAIETLVQMGLDDVMTAQDGRKDGEGTNAPREEYAAVLEVLKASNADLRATVSTLTAQLATKDAQISQAMELTDQSHRLQMAATTRALTDGGRPSFWQRITGRG